MNKPLLEDKALLTVEEAAALFGLSRRKMFRLFYCGNTTYNDNAGCCGILYT